MFTGWMPKLPSCPIPLTYQNQNIDQILTQIIKENMYEVVYRGPRFINSVQLHRRYNYKWRYREKYDVKVDVISDAIKNVGSASEHGSKA